MAPMTALTARHLGRATLARQGLLDPLSTTAAIWRDAVAALGDETVTMPADDGRTLVDLAGAPRPAVDVPAPPRLLARWDSLLLSHGSKHRQRIIADRHRSAVFTRNADVLPTFLVDGVVAGTWAMARPDGRVVIRLQPFGELAGGEADCLVAEAKRVLAVLAPGTERSVELARGSS